MIPPAVSHFLCTGRILATFFGSHVSIQRPYQKAAPPESLLIFAILCLSLVLMSGITPSIRTPTFRLNTLITAMDGREATTAKTPPRVMVVARPFGYGWFPVYSARSDKVAGW
jgi:hypothetical protein